MTKIETIVRSELDHRYPVPERDPDWDDVLRRAARPDQVGERWARVLASRRRRVTLAFAAAVLATVAATLTLVAPWSGNPSFVQQALAALGSGRYVHAVFEAKQPDLQIVELASGRIRGATQRIEWVYDTKTASIEARLSLSGVVIVGGPSDTIDPAVSGFANDYRSALASGTAHVIGGATVAGQQAKIIRFPVSLSSGGPVALDEDVLVSVDSHRPLLIRYHPVNARGRVIVGRVFVERVISIASSDARPTLRRFRPLPSLTGTATDIQQLTPADATTALGHTALWPGRTIGGAALQKVRLQRVTTSVLHSYPPRSSMRALRLDYRKGSVSLVVQEAASPQYAYGFFSATMGADGPVPPVGAASLVRLQAVWQAQLRTSGLFVTIRSPTRSLVIAAARALTPIP